MKRTNNATSKKHWFVSVRTKIKQVYRTLIKYNFFNNQISSNKEMQEQSSHTEHGLKCPECKFLISVSILDLIKQSPIICPKCGLKLEVDADKSADVLDGLKKIHEAQKEVKRVQNS